MKTRLFNNERSMRAGRSNSFRKRRLGAVVSAGCIWAVSALAQESLYDYVSSLQGDAGVLTNVDIVTRYATIPVEFLRLSGDQVITTNTTWGSTNNDARMLMVRVEGDLTVQAGATLTAAARKRGMIVQVRGATTIAGAISMTARGAANVPGDRLLLVSVDGTDYEVPAVGGAGATGVVAYGYSSYSVLVAGYAGGVTNNGTGGGGSGGASHSGRTLTSYSGAGTAGTSYSGGSGGGAVASRSCGLTGGSAITNGGSGGNGVANGGNSSNQRTAGGGAGNSGGSGSVSGGGTAGAGTAGTGGLLVLFLRDAVTVSTSGVIQANGSSGGAATSNQGTAAGGGGSGGGAINVFYESSFFHSGSISANAGVGGSASANGGAGGAGSVRRTNVVLRPIVSGRVVDAQTGIGLDGVQVEFAEGQGECTTFGGGYYYKPVDEGWCGTATCVHARGGSFVPSSRAYTNAAGTFEDQDFEWVSPGPLIAGRVVDAESGAGKDGVTVSAGAGNTCVTTNGGYYGLTVASNWVGTVVPSYATGQFDPASQDYEQVSLDQLDRNFAWAGEEISISGQVTNEYLGTGTGDVAIRFAETDMGAVADTNTLLLIHGNESGQRQAVLDASMLRRTMTLNGVPRLSALQKKFGNAAINLNGSSYLSAPPTEDLDLSTGDFTVDLWVRLTVNQVYNPLLGVGDGNASGRTTGWMFGIISNALTMYRYDGTTETRQSVAWTPTLNTWYHLAVVRDGPALRFFVDGVQQGADQDGSGLDFSRVDDEAFYVGGNFWMEAGSQYNLNGYLDEIRISKRTVRWAGGFAPPTAAYENDGAAVLLLHGNSAGDASGYGRILNTLGNAQSVANQLKYGSAALALDGTGDCVEVESSVDFNFGTDDFTVDWWEYRTVGTANAAVFVRDDRNYAPLVLGMYSGGTLYAYMSSTTSSWDIASAKSMGAATLNTWIHYAVVRKGTNFFTFRNGTLVTAWTSSLGLAASDSSPKIGVFAGTYYLTGYLDEFRITKGAALWTTNFTPPTLEIHAPYAGTGTAVTDPDGNYSQAVSVNWAGTAIPTNGSDTFAPTVRVYTASATNRANQNFSQHPANAAILGHVKEVLTDGGVEGVTVSTSDGSNTLTAADGSYAVEVPWNWSGTVSVSYAQGTFTSTALVYGSVTTYYTNQDYEWHAPEFTLSGMSTNEGATIGGDEVLITGTGFYGTGSQRPVTLSYSGTTLTNAGVPVRLDTARLIAAGRMRADGGDLRWFDADGKTALSYWLESGLNTTDTLVWVSVPLLTNGGKRIYVSYGDSARTSASSLASVFPTLANSARNGLWLKANAGTGASGENDPVSVWTDQSGNGRDATQETAANQPSFQQQMVNGLPAVSFDGSSDYLGFARLTTIRDGFFAISIDALQSASCCPPILGDSVGTTHFMGADGGQGSALIGATASAGLRGGAAYVNGASTTPTSITKQPFFRLISFHPTAAQTADQLARYVTDNTRLLGADWAETILFVDALTAAERLEVQGYLNAKYRLFGTNSLPTAALTPDPLFQVSVTFGGVPVEVRVVDSGTLLAMVPAQTAGTVDVVVSNRNGQVQTLPGAYTYVDYPDPIISGQVTNCYTGAGVDGVVLHFSGGAEVTTAGGGYYSQVVAYASAAVSVTVTNPGLAGTMVPAGRSYTNVRVNQAGQNYSWQPRLAVFSGRVLHQYTGAGVDGVVLVFADGGGTATTAGGGYFSRTLPYLWTGCVTPSNAVSSFSPASVCDTNAGVDVSGVQYVWTPPDRTVSGRVTDQTSGEGLDGVTVQLSNSGGTTTTVGGGYFTKIVYYGWSGTVTPATNRGAFTPASRSISVTTNLPDQNFAWVAPVKISGRITHGETGAGQEGVILTFSNSGGSTYTGEGGYYTQEVVRGWSGVVTPSHTGDAFSPTNRSYSNVTNDVDSQDYTWLPAYISGARYVSLSGIDKYPYTNWYTAAKDLQTAIHATHAGDNIYVADGAFEIAVPVICSTAMVIRSVNGPEWTTLRQTSGTSGVVVLSGAGVVLDGFTLEHGVNTQSGAFGAGATVVNGAEIRNSILQYNTNQAAGGAGGLVLTNGAKAVNCLIIRNDGGSAADTAGGVRIEGATLINGTVYGNVQSGGTGAGGVYQGLSGIAYVDNCIVWSNGIGSNIVASGTLYPRYSCYGGATGAQAPLACLQTDPLLAGATAGNYRLLENSPCVDAGSNSLNTLTTDIASSTRFSQTIDMGAYEYFHTVAPTIRGRVVHQYTGQGVAGASIVFSGGAGTVESDASGFYSNIVTYGWTGQAAASLDPGTMSPTNRTYTGLTSDQNNQNYTWSPVLRTISGRVTHNRTGEGVNGVTVQFSNGGGSVATAGGGYYTQTVYHGWSGIVTLSYSSGGTYSPAQRVYENVTADIGGHDYAWMAPMQSIAGRVTDAETGAGVDGVTINFSNGGGFTETVSGGYYTQMIEEGWEGSATPAYGSGAFTPASRTYSAITSNVAEQTYQWLRPYRITGQVTNLVTGAGLDGITVTYVRDGVTGTVVTAGGGCYTVNVSSAWSGVVYPVSTEGPFTPASRSYDNVTSDLPDQGFGLAPTVPISGRITREDTGAGLDGVKVSIYHNGWRSVYTADGGYYVCSVPSGWSGTVTLDYSSGSFLPDSRSYTTVTSAQTNQDFTWLLPVSVSGRVTHHETGAGLAGVVMTFSNDGGTTTTAVNGDYTQEVARGWSGTISGTWNGGTLQPAGRALTNVTEAVTGQDFVAYPDLILSGRVTNRLGYGVSGVTLQFSNGGGQTVSTNGDWSHPVARGWSGRVQPGFSSGAFLPAYRDYTSVEADTTGQDFTWVSVSGIAERFVSPAGTHEAPYTNWTTAATSLVAVLEAASAGETIWVSNATYVLDEPLMVSKAVTLRSTQGAAVTTLRGSGNAGVLWVQNANAEISGFTLAQGYASAGTGAGVHLDAGYVHDCILCDNEGQAVVMSNSPAARLANCLIVNNAAAVGGTGLMINCTVFSNAQPEVSAALVYNSIVDGAITAPEIRFTLAPSAYSGEGNLAGTPQFADASAGNYRLSSDSVAQDAGNNLYNTLLTDLDGRPRIFNRIDLGAYELAPTSGLAVALLSTPNPVLPGGVVRFEMCAFNQGPGAASGVVVTCRLEHVSYQSNDVGAAYAADTGAWTVGNLAAGAQQILHVWAAATETGMQTNVARISAASSDGILPGYEVATNVTRMLGPVGITNLQVSGTDAILHWNGETGVSYDLYAFNGEYGGSPRWILAAHEIDRAGTGCHVDSGALPADVTRRYYQVVYAGQDPQTDGTWGAIRLTAAGAGYTPMAPPLRLDRRFDGEFGAALAAVLQGNNGGLGSGADGVHVLQADGIWQSLYLDAAGVWRETTTGAASSYALPAGTGFWLARAGATPVQIAFTGPVGNDGTQTNRLVTDWNLIGLSEGRDLPLVQTLASAQPTGGARAATSDQLVIRNPDGTWRRLMYANGWGGVYAGKWFDLSSFEIVSTNEILAPGAACYYLRRGSATNVRF